MQYLVVAWLFTIAPLVAVGFLVAAASLIERVREWKDDRNK